MNHIVWDIYVYQTLPNCVELKLSASHLFFIFQTSNCLHLIQIQTNLIIMFLFYIVIS